MKITMLSRVDYAFSGHKLVEAISKHTDHDIDIFTGEYPNVFKYPYKHVVRKKKKKKVQERVNSSDIVHLKGDWPAQDGYLGLRISHKPVVVSVSGSHFRKIEHGGYGTYTPDDFKMAVLKTAFTPDLMYEGFDTWTPHPIDSTYKDNLWKKGKPPILLHMPTNPENKGTEFILEVFRELKKKTDIQAGMTTKKLTHDKAVRARLMSTIFCDQFKVGFYGNSALEAMQYGIPVANWISSECHEKVDLLGCPVINKPLSVDLWVRKLTKILRGDMKYLSERTKQWCDEVHSYEAVARQWDKLYNAI